MGIDFVSLVRFILNVFGRSDMKVYSIKIELTRLLLLLLLTFPFQTVIADSESQSSDNGPGSFREIDSAPVVVNGDVLFEVVGMRAYPARKRANKISDAIEDLAADDTVDTNNIKIIDKKNRTAIVYNDSLIFSVIDLDAEHQGIDNRKITAETFAFRTRDGIKAYRADRTPDRLTNNIIHAVLRTLVLVITLFGFIWLARRTDKMFEKMFKRHMKKLEAKSMRVVQTEQVWRIVHAIFNLLKIVVVLGLAYIFINSVLKLFPWTRYIAEKLLHLVIDPVESIAFGFIDYLPSLFFLVILFFVTRYVLSLLQGIFNTISLGNMRLKNFEAEWAWPTYRIVRIIVIVFAIIIAYPYIPGSNSEAFKGISLFLGVLLSLGSTSVISNVIAGYTMTYRRAFKVGDRVRIGETVGKVTEVRLLVTNLLSLKNEKIVIPNSTILSSEVINYSTLAKEQGLILHTSVGIGYEVPWRQVEAMLLEAAARTPGLIKEPSPFILQQALTDFAVTYELNAYCKDDSKMPLIYTDLHRNIQDIFNEHGVQIMTPNYVADTAAPKVVPPEQWYTSPATKPESGDVPGDQK
jgi:small-conductance mechanosensitive channel